MSIAAYNECIKILSRLSLVCQNMKFIITGIDGHVRLARLQKDDFRLFLDKQTTSFRLHDEQTGNGLRKIAW